MEKLALSSIQPKITRISNKQDNMTYNEEKNHATDTNQELIDVSTGKKVIIIIIIITASKSMLHT